MPVISCPECGREVSGRAKNCPGCGYPLKADKVDRAIRKIAHDVVYWPLAIFSLLQVKQGFFNSYPKKVYIFLLWSALLLPLAVEFYLYTAESSLHDIIVDYKYEYEEACKKTMPDGRATALCFSSATRYHDSECIIEYISDSKWYHYVLLAASSMLILFRIKKSRIASCFLFGLASVLISGNVYAILFTDYCAIYLSPIDVYGISFVAYTAGYFLALFIINACWLLYIVRSQALKTLYS